MAPLGPDPRSSAPRRATGSRRLQTALALASVPIALIAVLLLTLAGPGSAAAPPTGDAGASIATALPGVVAGSVSAGEPPAEREVAPKPDHTTIPPGYSHRIVDLKFDEGTAIRVRQGRFVTQGDDDLSELDEVIDGYPRVHIERLFNVLPEQSLENQQERIEEQSGREQADLNLYFRLRFPAETDETALIDDLNALDIVEIAYPQAKPQPAPAAPDLVAEQKYREAAPDGIDSDKAATIPGGRGSRVRIIDIEYSWNRTHEDLTKANQAGAMIPNRTPSDPYNDTNHGTAVLGEMVADRNSIGVTGAADQAALGLVNSTNSEDQYDLADSITLAHSKLNDGDVIIIEQQAAGPNGCNQQTQVGCVAPEWVKDVYDAIVSATSDGIIVVEPAGNGNQNLDNATTYGSPFPAGRADSGAIIVGAANYPGCTSPTHGRNGSSNYGSRVNLHAYGECVVTTGYGDRYRGSNTNANSWYTNTFRGTSSAAPIVASAAAILSSIAQADGDANGLTSTEARAMLAVGATPQNTSSGANTREHRSDARSRSADYEQIARRPVGERSTERRVRVRPRRRSEPDRALHQPVVRKSLVRQIHWLLPCLGWKDHQIGWRPVFS